MKQMKVLRENIKVLVKRKIPGLIQILGSQEISWSNISKCFDSHLKEIRPRILKGEEVQKDVTLFSLLIDETGKYDSFLIYCNLLLNWLNAHLSALEKAFVHRIITNLLSTLNRDFYNFIGELAVLKHFKSFKNWELVNIGEIIDASLNNSDADFLFKSSSGNEILIEVLNLHLHQEDNLFVSVEKLNYHLESKFRDKRRKKNIPNKRRTFIQPVIWYKNEEELRFVSKFYIESKCRYPYVLEALCYYCNSHMEQKGRTLKNSHSIIDRVIFEYKFGSIKTVFDNFD